jgi:hypothetical protein
MANNLRVLADRLRRQSDVLKSVVERFNTSRAQTSKNEQYLSDQIFDVILLNTHGHAVN